MLHSRRAVALSVALVSIAYVVLFVPPNLTGARDANMLAAFQVDEWVQYPYVMHMTTPGQTVGETLTNALVYEHYIYGYPFYLTSALAILPLRLVAGFVPLEATNAGTTANLLVLRQLSSIFMVIAVALLTYCWTGFEHLGRTLGVFLFLLITPAVFDNNLWWHAESLTMVFVALTIFALQRDNLRFGRWFVVAAIACGLGAATKLVGFWFFLAVAVYLAFGWQHDGWRPTIKRAALFAGLMAVTIVVTNPLVIVPSFAQQIVAIQRSQAAHIALGWDTIAPRGPVPWYRETLRITFGFWWVYLLALGACIWAAVADQERRRLATITLAYVLPYALYLFFFVAAKPARYFFPVMLPLLAALGYEALHCWDTRRPLRLALSLIVVVMLVTQAAVFMQRNVATYRAVLTREAHSPAIAFDARLAGAFLDQAPLDRPLVIYRDPNIYIAPRPNTNIVVNWDLPTLDYIDQLQPDLILVNQFNVKRYTDPAFVANHYRPELARQNAEFYAAVAADALPGYRLLLSTDFAMALVRQ